MARRPRRSASGDEASGAIGANDIRQSGNSKAMKNQRRAPSSGRRRPECEIQREPFRQPENESRFFVIDRLLEKRRNAETGQEEYLVRWKNYSPEWDTWEPSGELELNASDMINEFNRVPQAHYDDELHCTCRQPYRFEQGGMIQCNHCHRWFHFVCIGMDMEEANSCQSYSCQQCRPTTGPAKSSCLATG